MSKLFSLYTQLTYHVTIKTCWLLSRILSCHPTTTTTNTSTLLPPPPPPPSQSRTWDLKRASATPGAYGTYARHLIRRTRHCIQHSEGKDRRENRTCNTSQVQGLLPTQPPPLPAHPPPPPSPAPCPLTLSPPFGVVVEEGLDSFYRKWLTFLIWKRLIFTTPTESWNLPRWRQWPSFLTLPALLHVHWTRGLCWQLAVV